MSALELCASAGSSAIKPGWRIEEISWYVSQDTIQGRVIVKPTLDLYIGKYVAAILRHDLPDAQPWQWAIQLDNGVVIYNKDRRETFSPEIEDLKGKQIKTISYSVHDTTITFSNGTKWSLNPTQYTIADPHHGGEVFPQWPEELEEAGITSHPEEDVSAQPKEGWHEHRQGLLREHDQRHAQQAQQFLEEEARDEQS